MRLQHDLRASLRADLALLLRNFTDGKREEARSDTEPPDHPAGMSDRPDTGYVPIRTPEPTEGVSTELEHAPVIGYLAFQRRWLERRAIDPDHCTIIGVRGDAMEPTLPDGCSVLVDHTRRRRRIGRIFALRTGEGLMVRRAGKDRAGRWVLVSDHHQRSPVPWADGTAEVVGEVRWMATTLS